MENCLFVGFSKLIVSTKFIFKPKNFFFHNTLKDNECENIGMGKIECVKEETFLLENEEIKMIACGYDFTFILLNDGKLMKIGRNYEKVECCSVPTLVMEDPNISEIHCGAETALIYTNNGDLMMMGSNHLNSFGKSKVELSDTDQFFLVRNDPEIQTIVSGGWFTLFLRKNGELFGFGRNASGELFLFFFFYFFNFYFLFF